MNSAVTHDLITVALPFLTILAGTLFNNRAIDKLETDLKDVRPEIKDLRATTEKRFDRVEDHLTRLHSISGEHEGRLRRSSRNSRFRGIIRAIKRKKRPGFRPGRFFRADWEGSRRVWR